MLSCILPASTKENSPELAMRYVPAMQRSISFIGLGTIEIGRSWGVGNSADRKRPDDRIAQETLSTALNKGINVIDTANAYHLPQMLHQAIAWSKNFQKGPFTDSVDAYFLKKERK